MNGELSQRWGERLRRVVPWGSSTCSKSPRLMPEEPGVIVRGKGCRVWDADGREFIDYRGGLGPITLGYRYPAVDEAIRRQLESGIIFGHPHPLEGEVAELICEVVPCAERARFLKTGGEAVAACIKLARYHTGRDHVVQIGYNGWLNGLARGARIRPKEEARSAPPGVPEPIAALHHAAAWNDVDGLRRLCDAHGAVLVFDEIVTGFRIATGGVQEHFGVTPDLAVFAKGIANGMPLSVYCGRAEIMEKLDRAIVSSTYGGEALSLAAAKACIETYRSEPVIEHIWRQSERVWSGLDGLFREHGVPGRVEGLWPCPAITFGPDAPEGLEDRFYRAAYAHGVSLYHVSYVTYSHQDSDIDETLERLQKAVKEL